MGRKEFVMIRIPTPSGVERFINNVAPTVWCYETVILSTDILFLRDKKRNPEKNTFVEVNA